MGDCQVEEGQAGPSSLVLWRVQVSTGPRTGCRDQMRVGSHHRAGEKRPRMHARLRKLIWVWRSLLEALCRGDWVHLCELTTWGGHHGNQARGEV